MDNYQYRCTRNFPAANSSRPGVYEVILAILCLNSFKPPEFIVNAAKDALDDVAANQYSHTRGRPRLRQALSKAYSPFFGRTLNPETVWQFSRGVT
jgi:aspartate/methionine/tyrosine aminotransferase